MHYTAQFISKAERKPRIGESSRAASLKIDKSWKIVLLLTLLIAGFACGAFASANEGESTELAAVSDTKAVYVQQGDTLWSIASAHMSPRQDIREYIYQLKRLNELKTSMITEGQKLLLP